MKITLEYYKKREDCSPIYSMKYQEIISGKNAAECMKHVEEVRNYHDCAKYTPCEIVKVED